MERMNWGSTFAVYQAFEAQAGDKIKLEWSSGTLGFMTIMAQADFDAGRYGGPYPIASDVSWAVWQVLQSGTTVVFAVVEPPGESIQVVRRRWKKFRCQKYPPTSRMATLMKAKARLWSIKPLS